MKWNTILRFKVIKERQLSLGKREQYRGYEIVEVDGLFPYAILSPRGQFITFRASIEEAKARIDKEYSEGPVQLPESIGADGSIAVEEPQDVEYSESDRPESDDENA